MLVAQIALIEVRSTQGASLQFLRIEDNHECSTCTLYYSDRVHGGA